MTPNFTRAEFTRSAIALARGIDNTPKPDDWRRGHELARVILEELRVVTGPLDVTSWYRSAALNEAVGGTRDSAHRYGCAADLVPFETSVGSAWAAVQALGLPYDQCIWERKGADEWLHLGMARPGTTPRKQAFRIWR